MGIGAIFRPLGRIGRAGSVRKAGGGALAAAVPDGKPVEVAPHRPYTFLFREIGRPRLPLVSASEFGLAEARTLVKEADAFYSRPFDLFPSGGLFYEEVERDELAASLGRGEDAGFVTYATEMRKVLNDNERRIFLYLTPFVLILSALCGGVLREALPAARLPVLGEVPGAALAWPIAALFGLVLLSLLYHWPYKFAQQRNLLSFDNTITSRFSQLNQNFQVAKRRALNVERDKRMTQAEELKDEAGVWTLSYQWLALRLFLTERFVRNQMYQVNRNAKLYALGGFVLCLLLIALGDAAVSLLMPEGALSEVGWSLGAGLAFAIVAYGVVMAGAAGEARRVLSDNEWFRFSRIELDRAVAEHVGEDKLQIITFRDRNRFE
jgi:hypothetical protein